MSYYCKRYNVFVYIVDRQFDKMQAVRRLAMPIRVHQIWDAISSSQNTDFEKLLTTAHQMHKVPKGKLRN